MPCRVQQRRENARGEKQRIKGEEKILGLALFQFCDQLVLLYATLRAWQSFCVAGSDVICKFCSFYVGKDFNQQIRNQKEMKVRQKAEL